MGKMRFAGISLLILFCTTTAVRADICDKLLREFSQTSSLFIQCTINNGVPFSVCKGCTDKHTDFTRAYNNLTTKNDLHNVTCSDIYFDKNRLDTVKHSYEVLNNYWNLAFCNECLNADGTVSNETNTFQKSHDNYEACQTRTTDQFCVECKGFYNELNTMFKDITEKHNVCFDITDMMNRTRAEWTKTCGHETPSGSLLAFAGVSSALTSLPILFYLGFFLYYRRVEENYQTLDSQSEVEREPANSIADQSANSDADSRQLPSTSAGISAEPTIDPKPVRNLMDEEVDLLS